MIKSNYHTHCKLCNHAKGDIQSYVKHSISLGLEEIGISDHAPIPKEIGSSSFSLNMARNLNMSPKKFRNNYLLQIKKAKEKYGNDIKIMAGIETEYFQIAHDFYVDLNKNLDYMSLATHFFNDKDGKIKNVKTLLRKEDLQSYAKASITAMKTKLFKIFVHPDIFMLTYQSPVKGVEFDDYCAQITHDIVRAAIENNVYLEMNANGVRISESSFRSKNWYYPNKEFWKIVASYKEAKVIIGSGAHSTTEIYDNALKKLIKFAKEIGIEVKEKIEM